MSILTLLLTLLARKAEGVGQGLLMISGRNRWRLYEIICRFYQLWAANLPAPSLRHYLESFIGTTQDSRRIFWSRTRHTKSVGANEQDHRALPSEPAV